MPYNTPRALLSAISDRARVEARARGGLPNDLVVQFYLGRLLERVFRHSPGGWLLKGGQALLVRWPEARHSRDIDLAVRGNGGLDEAVTQLRAAAALDLDDFLRFEYVSTSVEQQERETRKVKFRAYCGTKPVTVVSVDVAGGLDPLGWPVEQVLEPPFAIDLGAAGAATACMWPLEDSVADKIAAMYERHRGQPSSRVKDLIDLIVIACSATLDGPTTHAALRREVARRTVNGVHLTLPRTFTVPDRRSWSSGYVAEAKRTRGFDERYRTLEKAEPVADRFVSPLLTEHPPGRWDHTQCSWS